MLYVKPSVINLGKSEQAIKGDCGWGTENFTLDKTGAVNTIKRKQWLCHIIAGREVWCCHDEGACSSESDQC